MSLVKSLSVGNGDMFYIDHNSDNFTTIDCCYLDEDSKNKNFEEIKSLAGKKGITRFISTHPDEDHIKGLSDFCNVVGIINFYCVKNKAIKDDETDSFKKYCELRDSTEKAYYVEVGCKRKWMNESSSERGCAGINFLWPDTENEDFKQALEAANDGKAYNNISPIFTYSVQDNVKMMWLGDMEHDFLEKIKDKVEWPEIDILFAPHHGRSSGKVSSDVLQNLNPKIIVIGEAPSEDLDYYSGYNTIKQNSSGDITFDCRGSYVHVYVEKSSYNWDISFLEDSSETNADLGYYLGSFVPKAAE